MGFALYSSTTYTTYQRPPALHRGLKGAATDGTAKLTLELKVSSNYKEFVPHFSLEDPDLGIDTNATGLMLYLGGWTGTFAPAYDAQSQSFKATYRVPQIFVRYGTSMEATDKAGAERSVNLNLKVTDIKPEIKLRRPPVVLVHGLWADEGSWKTFESSLSNNKQFTILKVNYKDTNADAIASNYGKVAARINDAIGEMEKIRLYSPKVNVIGHSMGGLLTREYCRLNRADCEQKINKFISIDTPHKGSELAQLVFDINQDTKSFCYNWVLAKVDKKKGVWTDPSRTKLKGALIDLIPDSPALTNINTSMMPFGWTAIAGVAESSQIYDEDLAELWKYLQLICGEKPDSTFSNIFPFTQNPRFNISNDRIVSLTSQNGDAPSNFKILNVDHTTVLKNTGTVDIVQKIIEN